MDLLHLNDIHKGYLTFLKHKDKIHKIVKDYPHRIVVIDNHLNFKGLLKDIGLCITALGVSLYEFNYFGIPVVLLCNYKKDKKDARILERLHIAVSLGYYRDTNLSEISRRINTANGLISLARGSQNQKASMARGGIIRRAV